MLIWAITSSNPGLCPPFPGIDNSKKGRGVLLHFRFWGGSGPGAPFGLRSSRIISFCSSQCLSHFALRNAYHTSLRPSSLFESRPPSLRVVYSLSQSLSHFTALFIVVRCALHRDYRVQLLFTWNPSMLRPSKCSLQRLQLSVSNCCSYGTLLHFGLQRAHLNICY